MFGRETKHSTSCFTENFERLAKKPIGHLLAETLWVTENLRTTNKRSKKNWIVRDHSRCLCYERTDRSSYWTGHLRIQCPVFLQAFSQAVRSLCRPVIGIRFKQSLRQRVFKSVTWLWLWCLVPGLGPLGALARPGPPDPFTRPGPFF